jgi:ketosteroid isomerase-like protein
VNDAATAPLSARALIDRVFAADHARDLDGFLELLTDDVRLQIGGLVDVRGKSAARRAIAALFAAMHGITHRLVRGPFEDGDGVTYVAEVTFDRKLFGRLTLPYANVLTRRGDRFSGYAIQIDTSRLLLPVAAVAGAAVLAAILMTRALGGRVDTRHFPRTRGDLT